MKRTQPSQRRRGVVLLIVLALLVIFAVLGVAFVSVARQAERSAHIASGIEQSGDRREVLLDQALEVVISDTVNANNPLQNESILLDMYGTPIETDVTITGAAPFHLTSGQFVSMALQAPLSTTTVYSGRVLTMTSGPLAEKSTAIVAYSVHEPFADLPDFPTAGSPPNSQYDAGEPYTDANGNGNWDANQATITVYTFGGQLPVPLDTFLINGRPFSGALAASPNEDYDIVDENNMFLSGDRLRIPEHIDSVIAPYNNGVYDPPDAISGFPGEVWSDLNNNGVPDALTEFCIPSYHRPDLIYRKAVLGGAMKTTHRQYQPANLIDTNGNGTWDPGEVYNDYTGKLVSPLWGPWDVDNDNDGQLDSVWVPAGLPVQRTADGRSYVGQFAYKIEELDSRINVNAGGTMRNLEQDPVNPLPPLFTPGSMAPMYSRKTNTNPNPNLALGQGFGVADVNLRSVLYHEPFVDANVNGKFDTGESYTDLNGNGIWESELWSLMYGSADGLMEGRNGENGVGIYPAPGRTGTEVGEREQIRETVGMPFSYALQPSLYGTPGDVDADGSIGLDITGSPIYRDMGEFEPFTDTNMNGARDAGEPFDDYNLNGRFDPWERTDDPYEVLLARNAANRRRDATGTTMSVDSPFGSDTLDMFLRYGDIDRRSLPVRLQYLFGGLDPGRRRLLTTDSWHVPVIPIDSLLQDGFTTRLAYGPFNVALRSLLGDGEPYEDTDNDGTFDFPNLPITPGEPYKDLNGNGQYDSHGVGRSLIDVRMLMGLQFDINRAFGNGMDDNANGLVDEPGEMYVPEFYGREQFSDTNSNGTWDSGEPFSDLNGNGYWDPGTLFDHNNNGWRGPDPSGNFDPGDVLARQNYARHLYILARVMSGTNYIQVAVIDPADPAHRDYVLRCLQLAQWAANAVDFRDSDSIMTPFEFDLNPFDGWDVDGFVGVHPGPDGQYNTGDEYPSPDDTNPDTGLVWGMERPELLITESLAFHDRRTEDTTNAPDKGMQPDEHMSTDGSTNDTTFDQVRRPQGSLFVELYNPWRNGAIGTGNDPLASRMYPTEKGSQEFYQTVAGNFGMTLLPTAGNVSPSWRMVISVPNASFTVNETKLEPLLDASLIERAVYFVDPTAGLTIPDEGAVTHINYQADARNMFIPGKGYAVIGPAGITYLGQRDPTQDAIDNKKNLYPRQVQIDDGAGDTQFYIKDSLGNDVAPYDALGTEIRAAQGIRVDYADPVPLDPMKTQVRFSATEPLDGYPTGPGSYGAKPEDQFYNETPPKQFPDVPYDDTTGMGVNQTGQVSNFKTVYLQRLANPLLPWNPADPAHPAFNAALPVNPYLTVDLSELDLSVYSGEPPRAGGQPEPANGNPVNFNTRVRTGLELGTGNADGNLWSKNDYSPDTGTIGNPIPSPATGGTCTLGYLNTEAGGNPAFGPYWNRTQIANLLGLAPVPPPGTNTQFDVLADEYLGGPQTPFNWLTWLNRPFGNPMELMLVPLLSPTGYTVDFVDPMDDAALPPVSRLVGVHTQAGSEPYTVGLYPANDPILSVALQPFPHLPNPFVIQAGFEPGFGRLLEYVTVPSRYSGLNTSLNPETVSDLPFHAPVNTLSSFREPGRININMLRDERVWKALMGNHAQYLGQENFVDSDGDGVYDPPDPSALPPFMGEPVIDMNGNNTWDSVEPFVDVNKNGQYDLGEPFTDSNNNGLYEGGYMWDEFLASRRGYGNIGGAEIYLTEAAQPFYTNPFRTLATGNVQQSILRQMLPGASPYRRQPLFGGMSGLVGAGSVDPATGLGLREPDNALRNAYFRNQLLQRLSNATTTRSSVFAIWITVGYFEVEQVPTSYLYPEGYRIIGEMGADTGEIKRNRGFYIFDRSIPVGFAPGEHLNTDDAFILKKVIE